MNDQKRKVEIMEYLYQYADLCSIDQLLQKLYVSRSTLRRDLIALEEEGLITRHHGMVSAVLDSSSEQSVTLRKNQHQEEKRLIARLCQSFLQDNMVLFLDSSSTVSYICPFLRRLKNLTVITNGLHIATQLHTATNVTTYICPGILKHKSLSIASVQSVAFLEDFRADLLVFSSKSISPLGAFEGDEGQAMVKRTMMKYATRNVLLCDQSKQTATGYLRLASFEQIDHVISETELAPDIMAAMQQSDCTFVTLQTDESPH